MKKIVKITFIRHGETDENKAKRVQGRKDYPLNETGNSKAKMVANYLTKHKYTFDAIFSSPLSRAYDTACIINNEMRLGLNVIKDDAFIERDFGEYEGMKVSKEAFRPILANIGDGLEKEKDIKERVLSGLLNILKENKYEHILVVAHSHTIKALMNLLDNNVSFYARMVNCSLSNLEYDGKDLKIVKFNIDPNIDE